MQNKPESEQQQEPVQIVTTEEQKEVCLCYEIFLNDYPLRR